MARIMVLASGNGTNFQALYDACASGYVPGEIVGVISDHHDAPVLDRARRMGIDAVHIDVASMSIDESDRRILAEYEARGAEYSCHAGYLPLLGERYCAARPNRAVNVHPSLLPAFASETPIPETMEWRPKVSGVTIHVVTPTPLEGPIVAQQTVPIEDDETCESLEEKIHLVEYALYPAVLRVLVTEGLEVSGRHVRVPPLPAPPPWAGDLSPSLKREYAGQT
jgi:phosphoribosylglycinamide formyltransferase-1